MSKRTQPTYNYSHWLDQWCYARREDPSRVFSRSDFTIAREDPPPFVRTARRESLVIGLTAGGHYWVCE